ARVEPDAERLPAAPPLPAAVPRDGGTVGTAAGQGRPVARGPAGCRRLPAAGNLRLGLHRLRTGLGRAPRRARRGRVSLGDQPRLARPGRRDLHRRPARRHPGDRRGKTAMNTRRLVRPVALALLTIACATAQAADAPRWWCPLAASSPSASGDPVFARALAHLDAQPHPMAQLHTQGLLPRQGIHDASAEAERDWPLALDAAVAWRR